MGVYCFPGSDRTFIRYPSFYTGMEQYKEESVDSAPLETLKRRISEDAYEEKETSPPSARKKKLLAAKCALCNGYGMVLKCYNCNDKYHLECIGFDDIPQGKHFPVQAKKSPVVRVLCACKQKRACFFWYHSSPQLKRREYSRWDHMDRK